MTAKSKNITHIIIPEITEMFSCQKSYKNLYKLIENAKEHFVMKSKTKILQR